MLHAWRLQIAVIVMDRDVDDQKALVLVSLIRLVRMMRIVNLISVSNGLGPSPHTRGGGQAGAAHAACICVAVLYEAI